MTRHFGDSSIHMAKLLSYHLRRRLNRRAALSLVSNRPREKALVLDSAKPRRQSVFDDRKTWYGIRPRVRVSSRCSYKPVQQRADGQLLPDRLSILHLGRTIPQGLVGNTASCVEVAEQATYQLAYCCFLSVEQEIAASVRSHHHTDSNS
jgi:hypothetical protein